MKNNLPQFKIGDLVKHKYLGTRGVIISDPDYPWKLVIQIHPWIFGKIDEDWELYKL